MAEINYYIEILEGYPNSQVIHEVHYKNFSSYDNAQDWAIRYCNELNRKEQVEDGHGYGYRIFEH